MSDEIQNLIDQLIALKINADRDPNVSINETLMSILSRLSQLEATVRLNKCNCHCNSSINPNWNSLQVTC